MNNNHIFRRLRYIFDLNESKIIDLYAHTNHKTSKNQLAQWLKKDDDENYTEINDKNLAIFLNGLIVEFRGKRDGPPMQPENKLNNNIILRKLKIALNMQVEEMIKIFKLADMNVSQHELTAFFRNPKQKQYRECQNQFLRNFITGLQIKYDGQKSL